MRPRWSPTPPGGPLSRPDGSPYLPTCGSGEERGNDASAFPSPVFVLLHPPRRTFGVLYSKSSRPRKADDKRTWQEKTQAKARAMLIVACWHCGQYLAALSGFF